MTITLVRAACLIALLGSCSRTAQLTDWPNAADFDVFVHVNVGTDVVECSTKIGTTTTAGNVDTVRAEWGETSGGVANGLDDGRHASIEVRPIAGTCAIDQPWQLEIAGNWN